MTQPTGLVLLGPQRTGSGTRPRPLHTQHEPDFGHRRQFGFGRQR